MTKIAIIGTAGSGKTVFSAVWGKRMTVRNDPARGYLVPDWKTKEYVNDVFAELNNGTWWRSTVQGEKFDLEWTYHLDNIQVPVKLIDSAGQDLKDLFSEDRYKQEVKDAHIAELLEYIRSSHIIILIVNLLHFRGEPDGKVRWRNESVYEEAIRMIAAQGKKRKIVIAWTAWDLYKEDIVQNYGSIEEYVKKELNDLHNAVCDAQKNGETIGFVPIAPVQDTESDRIGESAFRVPKKGFSSYGLDELSVWIAHAVRFETYHSLAARGDADALFYLGLCYAHGRGVIQNDRWAFGLFGQSAEAGCSAGQYNLAICYLTGRGTEKNIEEAKKWLTKAEKQGYVKEKIEKIKAKLTALETSGDEFTITLDKSGENFQ